MGREKKGVYSSGAMGEGNKILRSLILTNRQNSGKKFASLQTVALNSVKTNDLRIFCYLHPMHLSNTHPSFH